MLVRSIKVLAVVVGIALPDLGECLAGDWTNSVTATDVNNDSNVWFDDSLPVLNKIHSATPSLLPSEANISPFYDVSSDGFVTPLDFLLITNELNASTDPPNPPNGLLVGAEGAPLLYLIIMITVPQPGKWQVEADVSGTAKC